MFTVYDDCLPECLVDELYNSLSGPCIPWCFVKNITQKKLVEEQDNTKFGFGYTFFKDANPSILNDTFFHIVKPIPFIFSAVGILPNNFRIKQARTFLQAPSPGLKYNEPHIDGEYPHTVLLYYANDSDGDTVFFGKENNSEPIARVTPKRGRVVIFDGNVYHASCAPTNGYRIVVNFNLVSPEYFEAPK